MPSPLFKKQLEHGVASWCSLLPEGLLVITPGGLGELVASVAGGKPRKAEVARALKATPFDSLRLDVPGLGQVVNVHATPALISKLLNVNVDIGEWHKLVGRVKELKAQPNALALQITATSAQPTSSSSQLAIPTAAEATSLVGGTRSKSEYYVQLDKDTLVACSASRFAQTFRK